jgi:hypothetical protein
MYKLFLAGCLLSMGCAAPRPAAVSPIVQTVVIAPANAAATAASRAPGNDPDFATLAARFSIERT